MLLVAVSLGWGAWRVSLRLRGLDDVPLAEASGLTTRLLATSRYEIHVLAASLVPIGWSPEYAPLGPASPLWSLLLFVVVVVAVAVGGEGRVTSDPPGLDCGALGVVFPQIATRAQAAETVSLVRYAPAGEIADAVDVASIFATSPAKTRTLPSTDDTSSTSRTNAATSLSISLREMLTPTETAPA